MEILIKEVKENGDLDGLLLTGNRYGNGDLDGLLWSPFLYILPVNNKPSRSP
jgi:hypothetical protein